MIKYLCAIVVVGRICSAALASEPSAEVARLTDEVRSKGWILFSARSQAGDWDLFLMRPDGSERRAFTRTPEWNEAAPQFSRDGARVLYRRLTKSETIEGNRYGEQGALVIANSDGSGERVAGQPGEFPWASWSPGGAELAVLSIKGISLVDVTSGTVRRTFPRRGFFQQLTWSPDGKWLVGVANSFGAGWSIARMAVSTGEIQAVNTVDCCTPDWFPNSRDVVFSWRPPGQKGNHGQGWTQLWRADAEGKSRSLVYGEDGRHIYGGHISPDGRYAIFTGNPEEDGDPQRRGAPMGLMRLNDAPIIGGSSPELRALHRQAGSGPVLVLPAGWEPCWTFKELQTNARSVDDPIGSPLAAELRGKGWIIFSVQNERGDWDLFRCRPDGTERVAVTDTPEFSEAGARFSPDGQRLLYYRVPKTEPVDNNTYGTFDLVLANANGKHETVLGRDFPWACWGPDGMQIACLLPSGIRIVDVVTRRTVRTIPRQGIVQQLAWSPDGRSFAGTANGLGPFWNIGRLAADGTGMIRVASENERYNCTPDWCADSKQIVYARGIIPKQARRAQLWVSNGNSEGSKMLYAEAGRHVYGACTSPEGRYLLFTRSVKDLGAVSRSDTTMAIIRWADTPMIGDDNAQLRSEFPDAKPARRLDLGPGWEPHWTFSEESTVQ